MAPILSTGIMLCPSLFCETGLEWAENRAFIWHIGMQSPDTQERFDSLRQAWIKQNPVDLREDKAIEDAVTAWKAGECRNPMESRDSHDAEHPENP